MIENAKLISLIRRLRVRRVERLLVARLTGNRRSIRPGSQLAPLVARRIGIITHAARVEGARREVDSIWRYGKQKYTWKDSRMHLAGNQHAGERRRSRPSLPAWLEHSIIYADLDK